MKKTLNIIGVVLGLILLCFVGRCVYMVACISCTPPPVKTYEYKGNMDKLENNFKSFAKANFDIKCKISNRAEEDTIHKSDIPASEAARDVLVNMKIKGADITCNLVIYDFNGQTKLDVDSIFDNTHKKGGSDPNDKNVKMILAEFENYFFSRFNKQQHIEFEKGFFDFFN